LPRLDDILNLEGEPVPAGPPLEILLLADSDHPANVVTDHIDAFRLHSRHHVTVVNPIANRNCLFFDFSWFDAVIVHYSICVLRDYFLPAGVERKLKRFRGLKVQVIQDEYRWIDEMAGKMSDLGVSMVASSLSLENLERVYHHDVLNDVRFASSLPGYVPDRLTGLALPDVADRAHHIVYRGRRLPFWLGEFAQSKSSIGEHFGAVAESYGLSCDIATGEAERIYGDDWTRFLLSGKATLVTEGGASVFDFDGSLERGVNSYLERNPDAEFADVQKAVLAHRDGEIVHRTITPRVFEAAALRTALVMYPGDYRGVLEPWRHYIELQPDGSNDEKVVECLRDDEFLRDLTSRAYEEIIESGRYTMRRYAAGIDGTMARCLDEAPGDGSVRLRGPLHRLLVKPVRFLSSRYFIPRANQFERWLMARIGESRALTGRWIREQIRPFVARAANWLVRKQEKILGSSGHPGDKAEQHSPEGFHVLLLCDLQKKIAATVNDHIEAISQRSDNQVFVLPMVGDLPEHIRLEAFDAVIVHYTLIMCSDFYVSPATRKRIGQYTGLKAAFIQDEYRFVDKTVNAIRELGIDVLFTCVPGEEISKVYRPESLPDLKTVNVLTGYVPDHLRERRFVPYAERHIDIGYRGRTLPAWLGALGQEKMIIGNRVREDAQLWDLEVDISIRESDRIYGERWNEFMSSCIAVLGVESGASVFDFSGEIQRKVDEHVELHPDTTFEELQRLYFSAEEGKINLNQISPRCFEAGSLGTLMILYEGSYSGILEPWRHYVPLRKDHSNMGEVVTALRDRALFEEITENVRRDVIENPAYSYDAMARTLDRALAEAMLPSHLAGSERYTPATFAFDARRHLFRMKVIAQCRWALHHVHVITSWCVDTLLPQPCRKPTRDLLRSAYFWTRALVRKGL